MTLAPDRFAVDQRILALKPYQPGKPIEEVKRELGLSGEIVKLASNENPLGPSPAALAALADVLPKMALYPDGACHDLRAAVAAKMGITGDQLVFGNGSDEIIHLLGLTFLQPGDEVVVGDPTFVLYEAAATLAGAVTVKVPLTRPGFAHDTAAMAEAFTDRTRLVFIANPHNPTGRWLVSARSTCFLKNCRRVPFWSSTKPTASMSTATSRSSLLRWSIFRQARRLSG
jgi:histidinol-phosphate aminotransferase